MFSRRSESNFPNISQVCTIARVRKIFYSYFHYDGANIKTIGRKTRSLDQLRVSATYADIPLAAICQTASTRSPRMAYIWLYKFTTGSQCETISSTLSPTL